MAKRDKKYAKALTGRDIPVLTLDEKWKLLFPRDEMPDKMRDIADELDELLERREVIADQVKKVKLVKKKLLEEIPRLRQQILREGEHSRKQYELDERMRLISDCNEKIDEYEDEMLDLPRDIYRLNYDLMLHSMAICYTKLHSNTVEIERVENWLAQVRVELKRQIIQKQEREIENFDLYSYMHQIFGAEVVDLFDMSYDPEHKHRVRTPNDNTGVGDFAHVHERQTLI